MQKISTMQTSEENIFKGQLTIGLDLGDCSSAYCVLNEAGEIVLEHKLATTPEAVKAGIREHAAVPHGDGDGDTFSLGEPTVGGVRTRSNRGPRSESTLDHQEPAKRRSLGRAHAGAPSENRS
jgi:predicted NBD/HSP70 family sugar kinase